jgi:D-alanine transaminase
VSRIAYVNGRYVPLAEAMVHVEDRGFQLADGVYEVCEVHRGALIDEARHLARLRRSLHELAIAAPMHEGALRVVLRQTVRRNRVHDGMVYLQVTRGVARRDHAFPIPAPRPTLVVMARALSGVKREADAEAGVAVVTVPETRWARVDIKTVALTPNVLAKEAAHAAGAREAWFVDRDGFVTEGASTNAWIVDADGALVTCPLDRGILSGVTRLTLIDIARREGIVVHERPFTVAEAKSAREAFITASTTLVMPVVRIDEAIIGNGRPGSISLHLRTIFHDAAARSPVFSPGALASVGTGSF